jgi:hypothetical protein
MQRTIVTALFAGTALVALAACSDDQPAPATQANLAPQVQPQASVQPQATGKPQPLARREGTVQSQPSGNYGPSGRGTGSTNAGLGSGTSTGAVSGSTPGMTGGMQQPSGSTRQPAGSMQQQNGLVAVNLTDVRIDIARNLNLDASKVPVTIQLPVTAAANVCGVEVNALALQGRQQGSATPSCTANNSNLASQYVQNAIR